ncbi:MAG: hypothetical protein ABR936_16470 [Bacteroidota bacterium]|jgi:hypothetical protein
MKLNIIVVIAVLLSGCASFLGDLSGKIDSTQGVWPVSRYEDTIFSSIYYSKELNKYSRPLQLFIDFDEKQHQIKIFPQKKYFVDSATIKVDSLDRQPMIKYYGRIQPARLIRGIKLQNTVKQWNSLERIDNYKNTQIIIIKNDGSAFPIKSDSNGIVSVDVRSLVVEPYSTDSLGMLSIGNDEVELIASQSVSSFYFSMYREKDNWPAIKKYAQSGSIIYSSIRDSAKNIYMPYALSFLNELVSKKKYKQAIDYYIDLYDSHLRDNQLIEVMRRIPLSYYDLNSLSEVVFSPKFIYPIPAKGEFVTFTGTVFQVLEGEGFIMNFGTASVYCTVEKESILDDLFDGRYIRVTGVYKGTKTYTTVNGGSRTIPWMNVITKQIGF